MKLRITSFGKLFLLTLTITGLAIISVAISTKADLDNAIQDWTEYEEQSSQSLSDLIAIDRTIGYDGMIHNYKNYILRGDEFNRLEAIKANENILRILKKYEISGSKEEIAASQAIAGVIEQYRKMLDVITEMKKQGASLDEIDAAVVVDDSLAIEGLDTLDRAIHEKIYHETGQLKLVFGEIQTATTQQLYLTGFALFVLLTGGVYLIWFRVVKPLGILTNVMRRLSAGEIKAQIPGVYDKDEIGELAQMLKLYKKKSIENFKAEREIRSTHNKYANILKIANDSIISINKKHEIIIFNLGAEECFGYKASEVIGKNLEILIPDQFREMHSQEISNFAESKQNVKRMNDRRPIAGKKKSGETFHAEGSISKVEENGETFFTVILRDETERIRNEAKLKQATFDAEFANRSKSAFLANMSHELRTPLNAIIGFSSLLMESDTIHLDDDKQREYSKDIHESGQHLLGLISDLLDLSKIESGKAALNEQQVSPLTIIQSSINFIKVRADENNIKVVVDDVAEDIEIDADARMLKQMLVNLLSNAVKFTPKGGEIVVITGQLENGDYSIKVRDTGIGIAEKHIDEVILPFWQVDSKHERANEGTGLGLPLVKSLIELHGGAMNVKSQIGVGTTVELIIPYERVAKEILLQSNVI